MVALLALAGIVLELRRRRPAGLLLLIPMAVVGALLAPSLSPYAGGKLLVVLSPAVVLMAAIGGFALLAKRIRWLQVLAGLGLAVMIAGVLVSDGLGYREATLAPPDRIDAMTDAADHATGGGVWLVNEWEEFAKYFMRDIKVNAAFEAESPRPAEMRKPRPIFGRYYDLDALDAAVRGQLSGHHQAAFARSEPAAGFVRAVVRERLLRGLEASGRSSRDRAPSTSTAPRRRRAAPLRGDPRPRGQSPPWRPADRCFPP